MRAVRGCGLSIGGKERARERGSGPKFLGACMMMDGLRVKHFPVFCYRGSSDEISE